MCVLPSCFLPPSLLSLSGVLCSEIPIQPEQNSKFLLYGTRTVRMFSFHRATRHATKQDSWSGPPVWEETAHRSTAASTSTRISFTPCTPAAATATAAPTPRSCTSRRNRGVPTPVGGWGLTRAPGSVEGAPYQGRRNRGKGSRGPSKHPRWGSPGSRGGPAANPGVVRRGWVLLCPQVSQPR